VGDPACRPIPRRVWSARPLGSCGRASVAFFGAGLPHASPVSANTIRSASGAARLGSGPLGEGAYERLQPAKTGR
jgi:hypothetical protein